MSPSSASTFALKVLRNLGSSAPQSEEQRQFLARCSELGRRGLAQLSLQEPLAAFVVRSLHHFVAASVGDCRELSLELLAFVCGKDEDLEGCTEIRARYPVDELWNLMMDADEQFHQANGMPPVGPWNYWLIPLLRDKQAKDTSLINAIGFVAACVDSEILRLHAMREPELLRSLQDARCKVMVCAGFE